MLLAVWLSDASAITSYGAKLYAGNQNCLVFFQNEKKTLIFHVLFLKLMYIRWHITKQPSTCSGSIICSYKKNFTFALQFIAFVQLPAQHRSLMSHNIILHYSNFLHCQYKFQKFAAIFTTYPSLLPCQPYSLHLRCWQI